MKKNIDWYKILLVATIILGVISSGLWIASMIADLGVSGAVCVLAVLGLIILYGSTCNNTITIIIEEDEEAQASSLFLLIQIRIIFLNQISRRRLQDQLLVL